MELHINTFGASLRVKDGIFELSAEDKKAQIAPSKVERIIFGTAGHLTTDAIRLAVENNIDIVFLTSSGDPFARVWQCRFGSTAAIRRKQLEASQTGLGLDFILEWIGKKIDRQIETIETLVRARPGLADRPDEELKKMKGVLKTISGSSKSDAKNIGDAREKIFQLEARAGKIYFQCLSGLLPEKWQFDERSRRPARDPFNCFLNYAYGVLYGKVERACVLAGLDPYIGFLHTDRYGKVSLVYDIIEPLRPVADLAVFHLFSLRKIKPSQYDEIPGGYRLNKEGKELLIARLTEEMEKKVRFRNKNMKLTDTIQAECHHLANRLLKS